MTERGGAESRTRAATLVVLAVASLVLIVLLREELKIDRAAQLVQPIREMGTLGPVVFVGITFAGVMVGLPRLFFAGLGGYLFGFLPGLLAAQLGTLLGSIVTFLYGRALGREYVAARVGARFEKLSKALEQVGRHGIMTNLLVRNIPVGNSFVMTLAMSVTGMPLRDFAIGTFLGTLPEAALCAYFCNTTGAGLGTRIAVCAVVIVLLALVCWFGLRNTKLGRALRQDPATAPTILVDTSNDLPRPRVETSDALR